MSVITGSKIRHLAKSLDASRTFLVWIDGQHTIRYASAAAAECLAVDDADQLIGRFAVAGIAASDDPIDRSAAILSPPPGLAETHWRHSVIDHANGPFPVHYIGLPDQGCLIVGGGLAVVNDWQHLIRLTTERQSRGRVNQQIGNRFQVVAAGESPIARLTRRRVVLAEQSNVDLTITGPPGCEAETIACHIASPDQHATIVNGAILDAELLDAAMGETIGVLENDRVANRTVVIQNADEMPMDAQRRLMHWRGHFQRRLRMIALVTTPRSPQALTSQPPTNDASNGTGLMDSLACEVSTMQIELSPIVDRPSDLRQAAAAALDKTSSQTQPPRPAKLSADAIHAVMQFPWPGDLTELIDAMESALRSATKRDRLRDRTATDELTLQIEDLPLAVRSYQKSDESTSKSFQPLDESVLQLEASEIRRALQSTDGNKAAAARLLSISRARLLRKIEELTNANQWIGNGIIDSDEDV